MNLTSVKKSKTFFAKFSQKVTFKTIFWKPKCPFYWGVVVFPNICLFEYLAFLWSFCLIVATLPLCCHFVTHLHFCGSFAYFNNLCKQYLDVTLKKNQRVLNFESLVSDYLFSVVCSLLQLIQNKLPWFSAVAYVTAGFRRALQYWNSKIFLDSRIILEIRWTKMGIYMGGSEHKFHSTQEVKTISTPVFNKWWFF